LWTQRSNFGPNPRAFHAVAYDSQRGRVVLFAGGNPNQPATFFGDTWEWDGSYWTQMEDIGPAPRSGHAMVYDSGLQRTFVFGGAAAGANKNDTWQWDGEEWTQLADSGPSPRFSHAMAFDPGRNRTVLFGGVTSVSPEGALSVLQDTWEFDGDTWTQQQDAGPPGRGSHAMAYDLSSGRVVLFGGNPARDDTWAWDGKTWVQIAEFGPPGRENAAMALLPTGLVLFGGAASGTLFGDTWEFGGKLWIQKQDIGPKARFGHALVFDFLRNRLVLFGGTAGNQGNDPSALLGDTWEHLEDSPPPVSVASIQIDPIIAAIGQIVTFTLTLNHAALTPTIVQIDFATLEGNASLSITIPAGKGTFTTPVHIPDVPLPLLGRAQQVATVSASVGGTPPASATVTVTP
jgi:hypothetical protein